MPGIATPVIARAFGVGYKTICSKCAYESISESMYPNFTEYEFGKAF